MSKEIPMKHPLALLALLAAFGQAAVAAEVKLVEQKDKQQIDVLVDGQPFTSYVYWSNQKKPLLSPLRTRRAPSSPAASRSRRSPANAPTTRTTSPRGSTTATSTVPISGTPRPRATPIRARCLTAR